MKVPARLNWLALAALVVANSGCVFAGHTSSPWEWGGGVRVAPGFALGSSGLSAHPMASYTYLSFEGGHDALMEFGGQLRKSLSSGAAGARAFWIGGEFAISRLSTSIDDFETLNYDTNGWSLTGLVGLPVGQSKWGLNLYAGGGISDYGSSGINIRAGVDLQSWFLKR